MQASELFRLGDEDHRSRSVRVGIDRLPQFGGPKSAPGEELDPAFHGAEIPGRGIGKILIDHRPRSGSPAISVGRLATPCNRMEGLNYQSSVVAEQTGRAAEHRFNGFLA